MFFSKEFAQPLFSKYTGPRHRTYNLLQFSVSLFPALEFYMYSESLISQNHFCCQVKSELKLDTQPYVQNTDLGNTVL